MLWITFRSLTTAVGACLTLLAAAIAFSTTGCQVAADGQNLDGVRLYQQGNFNAALQRFQTALATNPNNADSSYNLARTTHQIAAQQQDSEAFEQAEILYNQCLDLDPDHVDCHRALAVLLVETDRADRAFRLLENWAAGSPDSADARIELARLYEEFGKRETAKLHLNEALAINQHSARAWAALGRIRDSDGEFDQAVVNYQRSLNLSFQPQVAERVAALNRRLTDIGVGGTGGTRTVSSPPPQY